MFNRLSLRVSLVSSVLVMGFLGVVLAILVAETYRDYAIDSQRTAFETIIGLQVDTLLDELSRVSHDLGQAVLGDKNFRKLFREKNESVLDEHLQSQFHQYFVTAGVIKLESLAVYDKNFKLISRAIPETGSTDSGCPNLHERANRRKGSQRLKTISELCLVNDRPYFTLILPIGGLSIIGYMEIVTDPVFSLRAIESNLGMPLRMQYVDGVVAYTSEQWPSGNVGKGSVVASYSPLTQLGTPAFTLAVVRDISEFEAQLTATRNSYMAVMVGVSLLLALMVIAVLNRAVITPLRRLGEHLRKIQNDKTQLGKPVVVNGNREVRELAAGFNEMTDELKTLYDKLLSRNADLSQEVNDREFAEKELKKHRDQLEVLVEQRTLDLALARDAALDASKSKSLFLANMSHELRTPLNAIIGYSEILMEEVGDTNNTGNHTDLEKIHLAGRHLLSLINDVLDLTKIETGQMDLYEEWFDIGDMVTKVSDTILPLFKRNRNTFRVNCPEDIGNLFADKIKVRQSLFNLLSNACKFSHDAEVVLTVSRKTFNGQENLYFDVKDNGIGMSVEQQQHVFEAFSQADPSTTRKFGGTGLGLVISQHLCNMMGGGIQLVSELGHGSTFTMVLPVNKGRDSVSISNDDDLQGSSWRSNRVAIRNRLSTEHKEISVERREKISTVLVIDDDPSVRQIMTHFLTQKGFAVRVAVDGEQGLALASELMPDAITLDVMMPGLDGWSVLKTLKADPELRDIPVILVTMVENRSMGYSLGAAEYLPKPVDKERLCAVLNRCVRHQTKGPLLVIAGNEAMRKSLCDVLELEGWDVNSVSTAESAFSSIATNPPALIMLDLIMPEMDGFEFLNQLRDNPRWRTLPVIIVTGKELSDNEFALLHSYDVKVINNASFDRDALFGEVCNIVKESLLDSTQGTTAAELAD
jgi:signal transduction histidine kinase/CheY-like chemotaxis protein